MAQKSKAYRAAAEKIEAGKFYTPSEAVALAKETGSAKFNSTVDVALKLILAVPELPVLPRQPGLPAFAAAALPRGRRIVLEAFVFVRVV